MPRRARPWYRAGRSMFYVQIDGKQHALGVTDPADEAGAKAAHEKLIEQLAAQVAERLGQTQRKPNADQTSVPTNNPGQSVADATAAYLALCDRKAAAGKVGLRCVANYRLALAHFTVAFGSQSTTTLTAEAVEGWADRPDWSNSYRHNTLGTVQQMLRHAKVLLEISRPPKESRGGDSVLTDEQFDLVLKHAVRGKYPGDLKALLQVLRETGARPGEASCLTAEMIDWPRASATLKQHKTRKKTGRDRTIHFNVAAMMILRAQREKWGSGLLFRTRAGNAYRDTAIVTRLLKVSARVGFRVIAYGLGRHSWATDALARGESDTLVAAALGHVDTKMVHQNYSHVNERARAIKDVMERARPKAG